MKQRAYLSPTSVKKFFEDKEEFYRIYLSDISVPRTAQTLAMAIGSGFDAYVKSSLYEAIYGKGHDPRFELDALFTQQVEPQNRDLTRAHARYVFECYKSSGAFTDLLVDLNMASESPQFEVEVTAIINDPEVSVSKEFDDLTLLGKPDLFYRNADGQFIILDWKVNGFYSKFAPSPKKGYMRLRQSSGPTFDDKQHKDCVPVWHNGALINGDLNFELIDEEWAAQLAMYSWILGQPVGSEFVCAIDQLVCKTCPPNQPTIRIAEHRAKVGKDFQVMCYARAQHVWDVIKSGHIFREYSKEESERKCQALDEVNRITVEQPDLHKEFFDA